MPPTPAGKGRKPKKVQTRIAFAPTESSSPDPEKASLSPARVVYESPRKSFGKAASSRSASSQVGSAPHTSQAQAQLSFSSVTHNEVNSDIDDDGIPQGKKFAVVIPSHAADPSSPAKPVSSSASNKQRKAPTFMPKPSQPKSKTKLQNVVSLDSSEDEQVESKVEAEAPLKKTPKPARTPKPPQPVEEDDEDDEPVQMTPRILGSRRKPSYLTESDEEPLTEPPRATFKNGRVVIPGEKTPDPSPEPGDSPKKPVNSRSFIKGGQLGQARYKNDYKPVVVGGKKSASPEKTKKKDVIVLPSDDDSSDIQAAMEPASSRKKMAPSKNKEKDEDSYDSEPAGYMLEHQAERAGAKHKVFGTRVTKDEHPTGTPLVDNDDDEDISIVRSPIKRLQINAKNVTKAKKPEPPAESDSEDETAIIPMLAKKRRLSPPPITDDENDDDLPIVPTPAKAKKGTKRARFSSTESELPIVPTPANKRRKQSNPNSDKDVEMADLDEDNDDGSLFGSPKKKVAPVAPMMVNATERARVDKKRSDKGLKANTKAKKESVAQRIRSSQPKKHRSQKDKAMELMRRKRNGEKITQLTDTESSEDEHKPKMGMYDTDSDVEVLDHFDDEEEEEISLEKVRQSLLPQNRNKNKESGDDDNFVVEDDDEPLGVPGRLHDIPLEFTTMAHKKLSEHFKDAVEWMVQRRINPGFKKDDPVYVTAFRKLDDDPTGLVNSKLVSTVWNVKFVRALKARPDYNETNSGASGEGLKCEACNRGKHPVSFAVQLTGKPYDKDTLEEVDQSDNEDDHSDNSSASDTVDAQGRHLPSSKKQWYLGSTCKANASAAHGLIHWKHFLDEWVLDALQLEGWFKPEKLAERALWKKKQLDQLSQDIVDEWTETKQLKTLYHEFKVRIESARNLTHERYANR